MKAWKICLAFVLVATQAVAFNEIDLKKCKALNNCGAFDLSGADLAGVDLSGAN